MIVWRTLLSAKVCAGRIVVSEDFVRGGGVLARA